MGISLSHVTSLMPKQSLDFVEVDPPLQETSRKRVAKIVKVSNRRTVKGAVNRDT